MSKNILIASHRGRFGASIPENTLESGDLALKQGADILEADVMMTKDGILVMHHDDTVDRIMTGKGRLEELTYEELTAMRFKSAIGTPTHQTIVTLKDYLAHFKGRCLLNLDHCWPYMDAVADAVEASGAVEQVILKSPWPATQALEWINTRKSNITFMPIINDYTGVDLEALHRAFSPMANGLMDMEKAAQYIKLMNGAAIDAFYQVMPSGRFKYIEIIFISPKSILFQAETIARLHDANISIWVNPINCGIDFSGGYDDYTSLTQSPDLGWGKLIDGGMDILQTDWVGELRQYLDTRSKP